MEIYQQLINTLEDVSEKAEIINIVNTLIEENGLSLAGGAQDFIEDFQKEIGI